VTTPDWNPSPRDLRRWAAVVGPALAAVGALFHFVDWGVFAGGQALAKFLWGFGAVCFVTGITGTKLGLPAYRLWTGFVYSVSSVIAFVSLALVYFAVVVPLALLARIIGRDRLRLRSRGETTCWQQLAPDRAHDPERTF